VWPAVGRRMTCALVSLALSLLSYVTIRRTTPEGGTTSEPVQQCSELAPGVKYCQEIGSPNVRELLDVNVTHVPQQCVRKVQTSSQLLLHYVGRASLAPSEPDSWIQFDAVQDFTHASALQLGAGVVPLGWDKAMVGLCEGTLLTLTIPPSLGFDADAGTPARPVSVPVGATLRYDMEIISVLLVDEQGLPFRPCFFTMIDVDESGYLDEHELERHFARINKPVPTNVMSEDTDEDGRISFDEFTGPKWPRHGRPPQGELGQLGSHGSPPLQQQHSMPPPEDDSACTDADSHCQAWAIAGECEKNPQFMHVHCKRACGRCDTTSGTTGLGAAVIGKDEL